MRLRQHVRVIAAFCIASAWTMGWTARAQAVAPTPTVAAKSELDTILDRLQEHAVDFQNSVPSFFCNEHTVSEMTPSATGGSSSKRSTTDGVFRVRRVTEPQPPAGAGSAIPGESSNVLRESRVINTIDGKPNGTSGEAELTGTEGQMSSPLLVFGVFSGGMGLVSTSTKVCFQFKLHPARPGHDNGDIVIDYALLPRKLLTSACPYTEAASGRAFIDPVTMRVMRVDYKANDHEIVPGLRGVWEWTVEYAPVTMDGKEYWMPKTIRSSASGDRGAATALPTRGAINTSYGEKTTVNYTLAVKYSDYHRLTVSSKIMPTDEPAAPHTP